MRLARLVLCASLLLNAVAGAAQGVRNKGSLVHLTTRAWLTLDPAASFDAVSFIATANVYEPLITFASVRRPETFVPRLASEVPTRKNKGVSRNGKVYRFKIREGVRFHDGSLLTPEDVRYSFLRFMLSDFEGGPAALLLKPVLGVYSTRDDSGKIQVDFKKAASAIRVKGDTVEFRLARKDPTFLKAVAALPIVVSKAWCVKNGEWDGSENTWAAFNRRPVAKTHLNTHMNGTGPFKLSSADPKRGLSLQRHDDYWREPAKLKNAFLKVVPNNALRLWMLESGDADMSYFEHRDYNDVREIDGVSVVDDLPFFSLGEVLFFTFNADAKSPYLGSGKLDGAGVPADFFSDKDVRQGFAYALDYEAYWKRGMATRGKRARSPFPEALLRLPKPAGYSTDLKKAEAAFRRARGGDVWKNGFTVTLAYSSSNASRVVIAELLKASLERINPKFKVHVKTMGSGELYAKAEGGSLPMFIAGYYADYPDPHSFAFGLLHSRGHFAKSQRYANSELDALIEKAASETDRAKRVVLYEKIAKLTDADVPQIYTYQPRMFRAARTWVRELEPDHNANNLAFNNFPYFYAFSK